MDSVELPIQAASGPSETIAERKIWVEIVGQPGERQRWYAPHGAALDHGKKWATGSKTFLADHPRLFQHWRRGFAPNGQTTMPRTLTDMELDFGEEARRQGIPVRLVALVDGELAGTIVLRDQASPTVPSHPALGGLFVSARHRGRGIGSELVRAGMNVTREQGYGVVYAVTAVAGGILERLAGQWYKRSRTMTSSLRCTDVRSRRAGQHCTRWTTLAGCESRLPWHRAGQTGAGRPGAITWPNASGSMQT